MSSIACILRSEAVCESMDNISRVGMHLLFFLVLEALSCEFALGFMGASVR